MGQLSVEARRKMLNHSRLSPPMASPIRSKTEEHCCQLGCGTPLQLGQIHPVMRV